MEDLGNFAALCFCLLVICLLGMVCAVVSHWMTMMFWKMGATESPAAWLAYVITGLMLLFGLFVVGGRLVNKEWFWDAQ